MLQLEKYYQWLKRTFRRKKGGFTGFRIELYRDGVLINQNFGRAYEVTTYSLPYSPILINGVLFHGYSLTPHLESIKRK